MIWKSGTEKKPLVTICIPNYNYGCYLRECLESVYNQTYDNIEIQFSDNASDDESYEIAQEYKSRFHDRGIFFRLNQNKYNLGSDKNSQLAISGAEGDYIYTLASDDRIKPDFLERVLKVFADHPNVGTVMVHRDEVDENGRITKTIPFYNVDCVIPGEEQAAVHMMSGIAIPTQRLNNRRTILLGGRYARQWNVAGDWYNNYCCACVADVAYIKDALVEYRVHSGNETNESELRLMGITEHYQLINTFVAIADSYGLKKPQSRYQEAVEHLGVMCKRYAVKMLACGHADIGLRYMYQGLVYKPDLSTDPQYKEIKGICEETNTEIQSKKLKAFLKTNEMNRVISYDPPEGWREL